MRRIGTGLTSAGLLALTATAQACPRCRAQVQANVFNPSFAGGLAEMLLPVAVLLLLGLGAHYLSDGLPSRKGHDRG